MEGFFLGCFAFGALFSAASFALAELGAHHHFGHGHAHHGHARGHGHHDALPLLNVSSLVAFLTWFGAAGYLLVRFAGWSGALALVPAFVAGAVGAVLFAYVLGRIRAGERVMDPADYRMSGTVARVTVPIPAGGTGEIVFTKAGSRRGEAARAAAGVALPRGTEVVVLGYDRGVATVQPFDEMEVESWQSSRSSA